MPASLEFMALTRVARSTTIALLLVVALQDRSRRPHRHIPRWSSNYPLSPSESWTTFAARGPAPKNQFPGA